VAQRILVVDDETPIAQLVGQTLNAAGYETAIANDGATALPLLDPTRPFDLIVLDMRMPRLDGWQFSAAMRKRGLDIPIVVMTAGRDARVAAEQIGAVGYITKPFDIDALEDTVRHALGDSEPGGGVVRSAYLAALQALAPPFWIAPPRPALA